MSRRAKVDTSQMPYVSNYPPLQEWLDKHEARCMFQVPMQCVHDRGVDENGRNEPPTAYVEQYLFPKTNTLAIVLVHGRKMGWDIFISSNDHEIKSTLEDAERRLGLTS